MFTYKILKWEPHLTPDTKTNSKRIKNLKISQVVAYIQGPSSQETWGKGVWATE